MSRSHRPRHGERMGCLLAIFAGMFPRIAVIVFWLARPDRVDEIFTSFLWPVLGIIFLPFTTLIYILLWQPVVGVTGWDWWWIALAMALDVVHWGASAGQRRTASPGSTV